MNNKTSIKNVIAAMILGLSLSACDTEEDWDDDGWAVDEDRGNCDNGGGNIRKEKREDIPRNKCRLYTRKSQHTDGKGSSEWTIGEGQTKWLNKDYKWKSFLCNGAKMEYCEKGGLNGRCNIDSRQNEMNSDGYPVKSVRVF